MAADTIKTIRLRDSVDRELALQVLRAIYRDEKRWVADEATQVPLDDLQDASVAWFVVSVNEQPVGVLRTLFDPPLHLYRDYGLEFFDRGIDVEAFLRHNRIAEVGRFAVLGEYRNNVRVVGALMRGAATEVALRGYSHMITDVFENDPHSPYQFHTRVLGFVPVATHETGELNHHGRRITLILDMHDSYLRLKQNGGFIFRFLCGDWPEQLHHRFGQPKDAVQIQPLSL
jgi:hypothetical protein